MGIYEGSLRIPGDRGPGLDVVVDLTGDRMKVLAGDSEIGNWTRNEVRLHAEDDGFHIRVEGEEVILDLREDARFAVAYGLKSAPPVLRRRMAGLMREDA